LQGQKYFCLILHWLKWVVNRFDRDLKKIMLLSSIKCSEAHVESEGTSGLFEALSLNPYRIYHVAHLIQTVMRRLKLCICELRNQPVPTVRATEKVARLERAIILTRLKR